MGVSFERLAILNDCDEVTLLESQALPGDSIFARGWWVWVGMGQRVFTAE